MKKIILQSALFSVFLFAGCAPGDIVIDDFESGTYDKWSVEGDAFGVSPSTGALTGQHEAAGYQGKFLANSFHNGDHSTGSLTSREFTIERDYISFLLGGGRRAENYIELLVGGESVYRTNPVEDGENLYRIIWDVKKHKGSTAVIRIVDECSGGWGHILADDIRMTDKQDEEVFLAGYEYTFPAENNYLLLPMENNAPPSSIHLSVDGAPVPPGAFDVRLAQTETDYRIPVNMEAYKGSEITIRFDLVKKGSSGLAEIVQADDFHFDYNEMYRPDYHFSPQFGWTNDPNGMFYLDGEYHLYYQHNPFGTQWGNMSWGHAVSKDLKKWRHMPVALYPDSLGAVFSGCVVVDKHNTAGFGENAVVALYTSAGVLQTQSVAYSLDGGTTFRRYEHNPVLNDPDYPDFRDPKVFWHGDTRQWIMALATGQTITFYASPDLTRWDRLSEFGEGLGSHGGVWECPDLFPLEYNGQQKWVLIVSINPGGPNGGSATQYFIGRFNGKEFIPDNLPYPLWLDYGRDNYAGVTWHNAPENRRIFIGWMSNWDYTNDVPTRNFRNAMTLPRELKLVHNGTHPVVASVPVEELAGLRSSSRKVEDQQVEGTYTLDKLSENGSGVYEIEMNVKSASSGNFKLVLHNKKGEELSFGFDPHGSILTADRTKSGETEFRDNFARPLIEAPLREAETYRIRLFIDKSSVELFVNGGESVLTNTVFPSEPYDSLSIHSPEGVLYVTDFNIHALK